MWAIICLREWYMEKKLFMVDYDFDEVESLRSRLECAFYLTGIAIVALVPTALVMLGNQSECANLFVGEWIFLGLAPPSILCTDFYVFQADDDVKKQGIIIIPLIGTKKLNFRCILLLLLTSTPSRANLSRLAHAIYSVGFAFFVTLSLILLANYDWEDVFTASIIFLALPLVRRLAYRYYTTFYSETRGTK